MTIENGNIPIPEHMVIGYRHTFKYKDATVSFTMEKEPTAENIKAAEDMAIRSIDKLKLFHSLPEDVRMKFYLNMMYQTMSKTIKLTQRNIEEAFPTTDMEKELSKRLGDIFCKLESTMMELPSEYKDDKMSTNWEDLIK